MLTLVTGCHDVQVRLSDSNYSIAGSLWPEYCNSNDQEHRGIDSTREERSTRRYLRAQSKLTLLYILDYSELGSTLLIA